MSRVILHCAAAAVLVAVVACGSENAAAPAVSAPSQSIARASSAASPFELTHASVQLRTTETYQLQVAKTANGKDVPDQSVRYTSADPSVATTSSEGLVTAVAPGGTTIAVTRGAHEVDVAVAVRYRPFEGPWQVAIDGVPAVSANGAYNSDGSLTLTVVTWNTRHTATQSFDWTGTVTGESYSGILPENPINHISLVESPDGTSFSGSNGFTSFGRTFTFNYAAVR